MSEKDIEGFKNACRNYFETMRLEDLRIYGRAIQLRNPTAKKKEALMEEIIKALCGEITPKRNGKRGAPTKTDHVDQSIFNTIERFKQEYLKENVPHKEEQATLAFTDKTEEKTGAVQFVVEVSRLNRRQKQLFLQFLESL